MTVEKNIGKKIKTGLALSSGFFGFFHHAGVLNAMVSKGIEPISITGNSAGAILGSMYSAGMDTSAICETLLKIKPRDFIDLQMPFKNNGFYINKGEKFAALMAKILPVHSFEACKLPFVAGVYHKEEGRCMYMGKGSLIQAVRASCAVPYLFEPVFIEGQTFIDGGFGEKTPLFPFLEQDIKTIFISSLPYREEKKFNTGFKKILFNMPLLASVPRREREKRDEEALLQLEKQHKTVVNLSPEPLSVDLFSLKNAEKVIDHAHRKTLELLESVLEEL